MKISTSSKASASLKKQEGTYYESKFSYGINYDMRNQKFQTSMVSGPSLINQYP